MELCNAKQDKYNQFDYLIIKGKDVKAFVEIRTRTHTREQCFVSANKVQAAFSMRLYWLTVYILSWLERLHWVGIFD